MLAAEQEQNVLFDKKLAQEEQWIREGIEARRTRNEGRVRALQRLRELRRERREQPGKVRMQIQAERRSGRLVIEAEGGRLCLWRPDHRHGIFRPPSSAATRSASSARTAPARPPCCAC